MTHVKAEIASQPECWVSPRSSPTRPGLPARGERVAVVGCGTSWFMGMAYAALRERSGQGETDAFQASEFPHDRATTGWSRSPLRHHHRDRRAC
jgi:fructoselysine-6-P-deglycase FrlB-like protein